MANRTPRPFSWGVFVCLGIVACISAFDVYAEDESNGPCDQKVFGGQTFESVYVKSVVDGDTLQLRDGRKVRLIGINTPEINSGHSPQPYAVEAKRLLEQLLESNQASLVPGADPKDNYGRTLAYVFDENGNSVEARMVAQGLAWHVAIAPNIGLAKCLAVVEREARTRKRGVWSQPALPVTRVQQGGFHRISGKVTRISFGRNWWISLENRVALKVSSRDQPSFKKSELRAMEGKTIELAGWLYPSHSKKYEPWRVNLATPDVLFIH